MLNNISNIHLSFFLGIWEKLLFEGVRMKKNAVRVAADGLCDDLDEIIGGNVRRLRIENGIKTQGALARIIDTSESTVSAIENGNKSAGKAMLCRIAAALHVKPYELLVDGKARRCTQENERVIEVCRMVGKLTNPELLDAVGRLAQDLASVQEHIRPSRR